MSKRSKYESKIELTLEKSSHNLKKLYYSVTGIHKFKSGDKAFFEALMPLIKENKIIISGYDFDVHDLKDNRIQSFKKEGVELEWIKKTWQTEIFSLLNQMDTLTDLEKVKEVKLKLRKMFTKKFRQYEKQEIIFYEGISKKVISGTLNDWIIEAEVELNKMQSKFNGTHNKNSLTNIFKDEIRRYKELLDLYPNALMWKLQGLTQEEYNKILKLDMNPELKIGEVAKKKALDIPLMDNDRSFTIKSFLEEKTIIKIEEKSTEMVNKLFNKILFFIYSHENYKFMKQNFALALSDDEDSLEWFELFINKNTNIQPLKERLINELDNE